MLNNLGKTKWVSIMTTRLHIFPARKKTSCLARKKNTCILGLALLWKDNITYHFYNRVFSMYDWLVTSATKSAMASK